ncbi:hypothetical protein [Roseobacter sp.]|uniref:hypothetical protein n=1 Tax=Roseobacter sp. TaxID=1907202 RepID=UPI003297494C
MTDGKGPRGDRDVVRAAVAGTPKIEQPWLRREQQVQTLCAPFWASRLCCLTLRCHAPDPCVSLND